MLLRDAERFLRGRPDADPLSLLRLGSRRYTDRFLVLRPRMPATSMIYDCASYHIFLLQSPDYLMRLAEVCEMGRFNIKEHHPLFHMALVTYLGDCHVLPPAIREAMRKQTRDCIARCESFTLDYRYLFTYLFVDAQGMASWRRPNLDEEIQWILQLDGRPNDLSDIIFDVVSRWSHHRSGESPDEASILDLLFSGRLACLTR